MRSSWRRLVGRTESGEVLRRRFQMGILFSRSPSVDKAANFVRRGDLRSAVREYARLFEANPCDWNLGNTLGDLCVKIGSVDQAVSHFTRAAEQLASDGFFAKARAVYRKILKLQPFNEAARERFSELDNQSGRSFRGRTLDEERSAAESGDEEPAVPEPTVLGTAGSQQPLAEPVTRQPANALGAAPVERGPGAVQTVDASIDLSPPIAAETFPIAACEESTDVGNSNDPDEEWLPIDLTPLIEPDPPVAEPAENVPLEPPPGSNGFRDAAVRAEAAAPPVDVQRAVSALEQVLAEHPHDLLTLERLIEVAVDGGMEREVLSAQARLADACWKAGLHERARNIAVDLAERRPDAAAYRELLVRVGVEGVQPATSPEPATAAGEPADATPEEWLVQSDEFIERGEFDAAIQALEQATCAPHLRCAVRCRLALIHLERGAPLEALACLESAAEAPPPTEEGGHELAYNLALTLEALGQPAQALGVYRELLAEAGSSYRDASSRMARLTCACGS